MNLGIKLSVLIFIVCIILYIICSQKYTKTEHFNAVKYEKKITNEINELKNKLVGIEAKADSNTGTVFTSKKHYNINTHNPNKNGVFLASGPLSNKSSDGHILSRNVLKYSTLPPYMTKRDSFVSSRETWYLDKDGTLRSKWDSINNQNGACMTKLTNSGKCTDSKYKSQKACIGNNKNWMYPVGLTKHNDKCGKFTWDSYGRLLNDNSSNKKECLVPISTSDNNIIVGLENCTNTNIKDKHLWTFY